jgi:hypothetical protein
MLTINGTTIELTRGDSAYISIPAVAEDGETPVVFDASDTLQLQVRDSKSHDGTLMFDGVIRVGEDGVPVWYISPAQSTIDTGTYYWDIQYVKDAANIMTYNSGKLKILSEVTV